MRTIKRISKATKVNMGGIMLDQALPDAVVDQIDPFLLIHHWNDKLIGGKRQNEVGVGPHPHRGFAPVTFIFKGSIQHRDSTGENSIIEAGGTQWMNSGSGLVHSERPTKELAEKGGDFEIIQFWVNAPAKYKMDKPNYQPLTKEKTPQIISEDGKIVIGLVAGELNHIKGKIDAYSEVLILRIDYEKGGKMSFPVPKHFNALWYNLNGEIDVNGTFIHDKDMIQFNNDGESIEIEAKTGGRAIFLSGKPINEELATYGPFVMNKQSEIIEALNDFQSGKMGTLIEKFNP